jgi:GntR family transcriptional regulator, transcriptional repressor for pyruvate dehydrogenase complex
MTIHDQAIQTIKEMIVSGELGPGERLPKEADLAARLGVSRTSLREAVRALTLVKVLEARHGSGVYVGSLQTEELLETVSLIADFQSEAHALHFLEARRILETAATAQAATRITAEEIGGLREIIASMTPELPMPQRVALDVKFHRRICEASGNPLLASIVDGLTPPTIRTRVWLGITEPDAFQRTRQEHLAIIDALQNRKPDVAASRATVHIDGVEAWLRAHLRA